MNLQMVPINILVGQLFAKCEKSCLKKIKLIPVATLPQRKPALLYTYLM